MAAADHNDYDDDDEGARDQSGKNKHSCGIYMPSCDIVYDADYAIRGDIMSCGLI